MDGLLLDSERPILQAWLKYSLRHEYPLTQEMYLEVVGRSGADAKNTLEAQLGPSFIYEKVRAEIAQLVAEEQSQGFALKPGVLTLLDLLSEWGVPCSVATSTNRATAAQRLSIAGILSSFQQISGGDEVSRGKPEPDIFLLAAAKLGLSPENCLVFEDSAYGARGAQKAGMAVIVIPDLKPAPDDVRQFARGIYPNLEEAIPELKKWLSESS